jgi:hypothetical protein
MRNQRVERKQWQHDWTPVDDLYLAALVGSELFVASREASSAETSTYRCAHQKNIRSLRFNLVVHRATPQGTMRPYQRIGICTDSDPLREELAHLTELHRKKRIVAPALRI